MAKDPQRSRNWRETLCIVLFIILVLAFVLLIPAEWVFAHGGERHGAPSEPPAAAVEAEPNPTTPAPAEEAHDHSEVLEDPADMPSHHPYPPEGVPRPLAWLGKFHPVATHFPIALLSMAALAEFLLAIRPQQLFRDAVRFCVWTGTAGALLAAPLGWFFAGFRLVDDTWLMTAHRWLGTGTAFWALLLLLLSERASRSGTDRRALRLTLLFGAAFVGATGFLGGSLIYGLDHYAW